MHDHVKYVMHLRRATLMHDYIICDAFVFGIMRTTNRWLKIPATNNTKMDVLFGMLALHLVSQVWPVPTEAVRIMPNGKLLSISDVDHRKAQFDLMGSDHCVRELTMQCLQNDSSQRPEISKVMFSLETLQSKFLLPSTSYLELSQVYMYVGMLSEESHTQLM